MSRKGRHMGKIRDFLFGKTVIDVAFEGQGKVIITVVGGSVEFIAHETDLIHYPHIRGNIVLEKGGETVEEKELQEARFMCNDCGETFTASEIDKSTQDASYEAPPIAEGVGNEEIGYECPSCGYVTGASFTKLED